MDGWMEGVCWDAGPEESCTTKAEKQKETRFDSTASVLRANYFTAVLEQLLQAWLPLQV